MNDVNMELMNLKLSVLELSRRIEKLEEDTPRYVTPKELSVLMKCSVNHIYMKIREGKIRTVDIAGVRRIPIEQFNDRAASSDLFTKHKNRREKEFVAALKASVWK